MMSRNHSNRYSNYGEDYDEYYDDTRDHRDGYRLPNPEEHGNKYKASRGHQQDPRHQIVTSHPAHHHSNDFSRSYPFPDFEPHEPNPRPQLPPPNLEGRMAGKFWHLPEQIAILGGENTRQSQEPAEGSEHSGRRGKKPIRNHKKEFLLTDF